MKKGGKKEKRKRREKKKERRKKRKTIRREKQKKGGKTKRKGERRRKNGKKKKKEINKKKTKRKKKKNNFWVWCWVSAGGSIGFGCFFLWVGGFAVFGLGSIDLTYFMERAAFTSGPSRIPFARLGSQMEVAQVGFRLPAWVDELDLEIGFRCWPG